MPNLFIDIEARFAKFQDSLDKIERDTRRTTERLERSFRSVGNAIRGLVPALSVAGFAAFIKSAIDLQDELVKVSQRVGVSVENLSTLRYAAELSDVSMEQLSVGLRTLARNMQDTAANTGEARQAFKALGVSVTDEAGRLKTTDEVLLEVSERFAAMEDGVGKTALALRIFGRSGAELIPLLNLGREGFEQLRAEAERLGIIVSEDVAKAAEQFNDNLTRLKNAAQGLGLLIAQEVVPPLLEFTERMFEGVRAGQSLWRTLIALMNLSSFGDTTAEQIKNIKEEIEETKSSLEGLFGKAPGVEFILNERLRNLEVALAQAQIGQRREALALLGSEFDDRELRRAGAVSGKLRPAPLLQDESAIERAAAEREKALKRIAEATKEQWRQVFELIDREQEEAIAEGEKIIEQEKERAKATEEQWRQIFETIDMEQEEAIENGRRLLEEQRNEAEALRATVEDLGLTFASAFEDALVRGEKLRDVLRGLAQDILRIIARKMITEPIAAGVSKILEGIFSGKPTSGKPTALQISGGFQHGGSFTVGGSGGVDSTLVAFRASPGERVTVTPPNSRSGVVVHQTLNIAAGVGPSVRAEVLRLLPDIQRATLAAVADAKRRGGAFASVFET